MPVEDSTPILVGVGQTNPANDVGGMGAGDAPSSVDLMAAAARAAIEDSGRPLASELDCVVAVRTFADSTARPLPREGRVSNPPRSLARRLGAQPHRAIYSQAGGETPQRLVNELAQRIALGEIGCALIAGGENLATVKHAARHGIELDFTEHEDGAFEDRGFGTLWLDASDIAHELYRPIDIYPLFEQAIRDQRGATVEQHLLSMGRLFAPFSEVAASNRHAYRPRLYTAEELADATGRNGFLGHPYPRAMNARDGVDMGAALVLTSVGKARALGIRRDRWVFLHGCAAVRDALYLRGRRDFHSSPGIAAAAQRALGMAGVGVDELTHFDLYSCFPSAVEIACAELGIAEDDPRGLTLTGGLPFFGGPGNNYSTHAIAEAVKRCRMDAQAWVWVSANGGSVTKHAVGIYSAQPKEGTWRRADPQLDQAIVDAILGPPTVDTPAAGAASLETATAIHEAGHLRHGFVVARKTEGPDRGARFIARVEADGGIEELLDDELVGRSCRVVTVEGVNRVEMVG